LSYATFFSFIGTGEKLGYDLPGDTIDVEKVWQGILLRISRLEDPLPDEEVSYPGVNGWLIHHLISFKVCGPDRCRCIAKQLLFVCVTVSVPIRLTDFV